MNNPLLYQVVGGLLVAFFLFFLVYMFTKTWRVWHVISMVLVFGASIAFTIYASMTLRTHNAWRTMVSRQTIEVKKLESARDKLLRGDLTEVIQTEPSIRSLHGQIGRVLLDRGRVWRECTPGQVQPDDSVTVSTVPAGAAEGETSPNPIDQNMILFAFIEVDAPPELNLPGGSKVPRAYLGEFTAAAVTDTTVTLKPTVPLDPLQKQLLQQLNLTWALHETMPVDGHRYFAVDPDKELDLNRDANVAPVFGQMDEQFLRKLIVPFQGQPQEDYEKTIQSYVRDGKRAQDDDPPDNTWVKVRFLKAYEEKVDSDAKLGAKESSDTFFDRGRAEVPLLQRGGDGTAKFKKGDVGVFPREDANRLIGEQVAEMVEPIYVRKLHNYEYSFRKISQRLERLDADIGRVQRDIAALTQTNQKTLEQISYREQERDKVKEDLAKFVYERDQITQYAATLATKWEERLGELSRLFRTNAKLADDLARISRELTEEINRRTAEAVAETR